MTTMSDQRPTSSVGDRTQAQSITDMTLVDSETIGAHDEHEDAEVARHHAGRAQRFAEQIVVALALPVLLYVILRPENYSLTPNSLDPVFYTGYATNFDDLINAVGQQHYFVTRWTAYYPMYVLDAIVGAEPARLVWRWIVASFALVAVWSLDGGTHSSRSPRSVQVLVGVLTLTMPIFVRAFFTDYVEYFVVSFGLVLVVLALREQQRWWSSLAIGGIAASILIANPVAIFMVALCSITSIVMGCHRWVERARHVGLALFAGGVTVLGGLVLFRWQYGLTNVYRPTIAFLRTYEGDPAAWKSPRLDWLARFTWLFGPPILLVSAWAVAWRRNITWSKVERAGLYLCAAQYLIQWYDQFGRDGFGLELSFYWSFVYPAYAVALVLVVRRFTLDLGARGTSALVVGWLVLLYVGVPQALRLPPGVVFGVLAVAICGAAAFLARRAVAAALAIVLGLIAWTQLGAPSYDPTAYFFLDVSPRYDQLFRKAGRASEQVLNEAVWFEDEMDRVANDASTSFVVVGGWASSISGLYAPHVTGRLLSVTADGQRLTPTSIAEIKSGARPIVAVFGPPVAVASMVATFDSDLGVGKVVLDEQHQSALGYRLVVFQMPDATRLPFTWTADSLQIASGEVVGTTVVTGPADPVGFVTFGPYAPLEAGTYRVALRYRADAPTNVDAGSLDVAPFQGASVASVGVPGTEGAWATADLEFSVADGGLLWEFRTSRWANSAFTVDSITLSAG